MLAAWLSKFRTTFDLGFGNIWAVLWYRLRLRLRIHPVQGISAQIPSGPFFSPEELGKHVDADIRVEWKDRRLLFGWKELRVDSTEPNFLTNVLTGTNTDAHEQWWNFPDFSPETGDIKLIWEQSRFEWALPFAQRARNGDTESLEKLNRWINKWCEQNPPFYGPNWKCGQEASLRILHIAVAALILEKEADLLHPLAGFISAHISRIKPTIGYAVAQDNNHGTAEGAGLFVGGSWIAAHGYPGGKEVSLKGRDLLENRVSRLINDYGGFSMYSLNYHRAVVDTLSICEIWRRRLALEPFSDGFYHKSLKAVEWLNYMIDARSGDGPNIGANDGSLLFPLTNAVFRDYRTSVQVGCAVFAKKRAYSGAGPWSGAFSWLGLKTSEGTAKLKQNFVDRQSGFAVLQNGTAKVVLRFPKFQFRPSQADALHLDFWLDGQNILRDGGSYSYYADENWTKYFGGTESHNTIQFDGRDQMRRAGRFLFTNWMKVNQPVALTENRNNAIFSTGYRDAEGADHFREVSLSRTTLKIVDTITGFAKIAVLRWRLAPGAWTVEGYNVTNGDISLAVSCNRKPTRFEIVKGWESRHYLEKTELPVLEVEFSGDAEIITEIMWNE